MSKKVNLSQDSSEQIIPSDAYIEAFDYSKEIRSNRKRQYQLSHNHNQLHQRNNSNSANEIVKDHKVDRCNFVFFTFFMYGVSIGLPWNVFVPIINFFISKKFSNIDDDFERVFLLVLVIIWQVTFVFTNIINHINCRSKKCNQRDRIPFVLALSILITLAFIIFIINNPKNWVYQLLILICFVAFINSAAGGFLFSSAFYSASMFPMDYTNSIILGMSLSGLLNSLINILIREFPTNMAMYGITFFVMSLGCLLITFISHFSLPISPFYNYHVELSKVKQIFTTNTNSMTRVSYSKIIWIIWPYLFAIWFTVFSITLVFPHYQVMIKPFSTSFFINNKWYAEITCTLTFNVMFILGNLTGQFKCKPGVKWIAALAIIKSLASVSFFVFCNYAAEERTNIPVYVKSDVLYWSISAFFAFLSGYIISLLMMCTPSQIKEHYSSAAALLSSFMIVVGIMSGLQFSRLFQSAVLL